MKKDSDKEEIDWKRWAKGLYLAAELVLRKSKEADDPEDPNWPEHLESFYIAADSLESVLKAFEKETGSKPRKRKGKK